MSKKYDFEEELQRVVRRANRLRAAMSGDATVTEVPVKSVRVRAHTRRAHTRLVITTRKKR